MEMLVGFKESKKMNYGHCSECDWLVGFIAENEEEDNEE